VLHQYLSRHGAGNDSETLLKELLQQQKTTNRLLQAILCGGIGFVIGLVVLQVLLRIRF
jgi:ubiquinone biosynthesis protein